MPRTEITKPGETSPSRPRDVFSAMRDEMDRVFGRYERLALPEPVRPRGSRLNDARA